MRLNLHKSIFTDKNDIELSQILVEAYRRRISVHIEEQDSYEAWLANRPKLDQIKWDLLVKSSASLHMTAKTSCIFQVRDDVGEPDWEADIPIVTVDDVDYLVKLPITIALENGRNDRNFLLSASKAGLRERLMELEKQKALVFDGPGGINELINNMKGSYISHLANRHKFWLLFDGDAPVPDRFSEDSVTLKNLCEENKFVNHHRLSRRSIENYLPVSGSPNIEKLCSFFEVSGDDREELMSQLTCFSSLSEEQRYHYHMKEGLKKPSCKNSGLYDGLDRKVKKLIGRGFKVRIDSLYDFGADAPPESFEPLHELLVEDGALQELSGFLRQIDFNTRKTK